MSILDVSPHQYTHLLSSHLRPGRNVGVVTRCVHFADARPPEHLQRMWHRMLTRFTALRARFYIDNGNIRQELRRIDDLPEQTRVLARTAATRLTPAYGSDVFAGSLDPFGDVLLRGAVGSDGRVTRLLFQIHHALVDEHSMALMLAELGSPTDPRDGAGRANSDETAYRSAVRAVQEAAASARTASADFWRTALSAPLQAAAPRWRDDPGEPGGHHTAALDTELVEAVRCAAREAGTSLAVFVHAAVVVLLHRYGLGDRIAIGTPVTLRDHAEIGFEIAGPFLNVLPVVTTVGGDDKISEVLRRVHDSLLELHEHKHTPLAHLTEIAGVARDSVVASATDYFGLTVATHQENPVDWPVGVTLQSQAAPTPGAGLSIDLVAGRDTSRLTVAWQAGLRLWPAAARLDGHLRQILAGMVSNPEASVRELAFSDRPGTAVRRVAPQLRAERNVGGGGYQSVWNAVQRFTEQTPESIALVDGGLYWSYADLFAAVAHVRRGWRVRALPRGARVGVAFGRSRWQLVHALAAWAEGLCYVPVDLRLPRARLDFILSDANVRVLSTAANPADPNCDVWRFDDRHEVRPHLDGPSEPPAAGVPADALAYVMYTSGSSGHPKGVGVTHANLHSFLTAIAAALPETTAGTWLAETAPTFDISLLEMCWPLWCGQTVLFSDPGDEYTRSHAQPAVITFDHRQCTPSRARQVLDARDVGAPIGHWQVAPRTWLIGGEVLSAPLLHDLRRAYPTTRFVNMYGPTEATIWSTYHVVTGDERDEVPIGVPLLNTVPVVVDERGGEVPDGVAGELVLAGTGIAAGYIGEHAGVNPFSVLQAPPAAAQPAYHTGDVAVVGADGNLYFRGRRDSQMKLRGHRIELIEVEQHLVEAPGVTEAVATVLTAPGTPAGDARLVAAVAGTAGLVSGSALRRWLADRLPDVMVPVDILVLDALPRQSSGKVDRVLATALCRAATVERRALDREADEPADRGQAPASDNAVLLARVAAQVVGSPFAADDNFFDRGGNSMSALRLVAAARDAGLAIELTDVFDLRTIRQVAERASVLEGHDVASPG